MINDSYISGFFDADGSITMSKSGHNDSYRTLKIDFTNTQLETLKDIQKYLQDTYGLKLFLVTKPSTKEQWSESYTLTTSANRVCYKLCEIIKSHHPKKIHRINTVLKYHNVVVKRNGKYNEREKMRRLAYERLFFSNAFQH
ncbi:MAG: LAGLIDADG family homing endonuclease [Butyrivibrio sp.]|nr:LAGLIDADG family homing endonuclease [Butyrivibrio sp.]